MTDYKTVFGKKIKFQTSDLTMSTATEGELFYSDSANEFKVGVNINAWASSDNVNTARDSLGATTQGAKDAVLAFGGHLAPPTYESVATESYDGSAWTEVGDLPVKKQLLGSAGTQTAALSFGGSKPPSPPLLTNTTEEWDGSSWTSGGAMNDSKYVHNSNAGTQTAGLGFGGYGGGNNTEEYNGTSWSEQNNLTNGKPDMAGFGTQTAAVGYGGTTPSFAHAETEEYDGTSWTASNDMNQINRRMGGAGVQTNGITFGGLIASGSVTNKSENYDGTSWTVFPTMGTGRYYLGAHGAAVTSAMAIGGLTTGSASSFTNITEEFSGTVTLKTVTDS